MPDGLFLTLNRRHSWLCAQKLSLSVLKGPCMIPHSKKTINFLHYLSGHQRCSPKKRYRNAICKNRNLNIFIKIILELKDSTMNKILTLYSIDPGLDFWHPTWSPSLSGAISQFRVRSKLWAPQCVPPKIKQTTSKNISSRKANLNKIIFNLQEKIESSYSSKVRKNSLNLKMTMGKMGYLF